MRLKIALFTIVFAVPGLFAKTPAVGWLEAGTGIFPGYSFPHHFPFFFELGSYISKSAVIEFEYLPSLFLYDAVYTASGPAGLLVSSSGIGLQKLSVLNIKLFHHFDYLKISGKTIQLGKAVSFYLNMGIVAGPQSYLPAFDEKVNKLKIGANAGLGIQNRMGRVAVFVEWRDYIFRIRTQDYEGYSFNKVKDIMSAMLGLSYSFRPYIAPKYHPYKRNQKIYNCPVF